MLHFPCWLVEERYPEAEYIRRVLDNLNTPGPAALYEAFPAEQARAIAARVEFQHTLKHGSWLNLAAIGISLCERGCLARPAGDLSALQRRVKALEVERNAPGATIRSIHCPTGAGDPGRSVSSPYAKPGRMRGYSGVTRERRHIASNACRRWRIATSASVPLSSRRSARALMPHACGWPSIAMACSAASRAAS